MNTSATTHANITTLSVTAISETEQNKTTTESIQTVTDCDLDWRPNNNMQLMKSSPVESNGSLPPGGWLKVTCGLTACTPGSAPGPTLGNEYGGTLPFLARKSKRRP